MRNALTQAGLSSAVTEPKNALMVSVNLWATTANAQNQGIAHPINTVQVAQAQPLMAPAPSLKRLEMSVTMHMNVGGQPHAGIKTHTTV